MVSLNTAKSAATKACLRTYGRADVTLRGYLDSPLGRTPCSIRDLSLGGARVETEQKLAPDQSIWLSLGKLRIFGTVKWVRGNLVGIQFEEKLPKSIVLNLRGEAVDPEALAEMEAMLAAQSWVIGAPVDRPKSVRLADVLGAREKQPDKPLTGSTQAAGVPLPERSTIDQSGKRRAAAIIAMSAVTGLLIGFGSILIF